MQSKGSVDVASLKENGLPILLSLSETNVLESGRKLLEFFQDKMVTKEDITSFVSLVKIAAEIRPQKNQYLSDVLALIYNFLPADLAAHLNLSFKALSPLFLDFWQAQIDVSARPTLSKIPEQPLFDDMATSLPDTILCCINNKRQTVPLIVAAAYYGSTKIFRAREKDIMTIKSDEKQLLAEAAVAGGSADIMKKVAAKNISLENCWEQAIKYHRNSAFNWIEKKYKLKISQEMIKKCEEYGNSQLLQVLKAKL